MAKAKRSSRGVSSSPAVAPDPRFGIIFVHGAGTGGESAWPVRNFRKLNRAQVFVTRPGYADNEPATPTNIEAEFDVLTDAARTVTAEALRKYNTAVPSPVHLVGHSYGAIPSVLYAEAFPERVASLTLIEPALYSLASESTAVRSHVEKLGPVFEGALEMDAPEFARAFFTALGHDKASVPTTTEALVGVERIRLSAAPWTFEFRTDTFSRIPTLAISGGWNDEYEQISDALETLGAQRATITGNGHRPHDTPLGLNLLGNFFRAIEAQHGDAARSATPLAIEPPQ